jgi:hypothetical protein
MIATSVVYPLTQKYRQSARLEEREGYSLVSLQPAITAEIAMQAGSHSEALLRGKEQLNGYLSFFSTSQIEAFKNLTEEYLLAFAQLHGGWKLSSEGS